MAMDTLTPNQEVGMKSLMCLLQEVLLDRGTWCGVSTTRDFKTIASRVEHEGLSFLTITLPAFGAELQKALDQGSVDIDMFPGFTRTRRHGGLPRFLSGFLSLVFDSGTCRLLDEPNIDAIQAIRQITLMFAKIQLPCSDAREKAAIAKYVECENDVKAKDSELSTPQREDFDRISRLLWSDVLQQVDEDIYYGRLVPKHGPGATADKLMGNQKYRQKTWTSRLEPLFPHGEFLVSSWRQYASLPEIDIVEPGSELPVRVITVPKTLKTPRIIAVEPTCMQYTQQALSTRIVKLLEASDSVSCGLIGFSDQTPNQRMAQEGSLTGKLATLDLSEASDRVSNQLVRIMTRCFPHVAEGLDATRSRKADVPGYGVIRLAKYASMGSALCFPIEAMVFTSIVMLGIEKQLRRRLTRRDVKRLKGQVRVYGDDIIVPADFAVCVARELETFGLLVNRNKSFWTGKFRESCGKEYYDGHDISIVRVRRVLPSQRKDDPELISAVSLRNQLYKAGYWRVCGYLDDELRKLIPYPVIHDTSPVQGRVSFLSYQAERIHSTLHMPLVKGIVVTPVIPKNALGDYGALLKFFLLRGESPGEDKKHLERSGRARSVRTKTRWAQPY